MSKFEQSERDGLKGTRITSSFDETHWTEFYLEGGCLLIIQHSPLLPKNTGGALIAGDALAFLRALLLTPEEETRGGVLPGESAGDA